MGDLDNCERDTKSSLPCGRKGERKVISRHGYKKEDNVFNSGIFPTLSDKKLEKMTIRELNEYTRKIPKHRAQELKKRRRILKNRRYAFKCRLKSNRKRKNMAYENVSLEKELSATKRELKTILSERDYYKSKCVELYSRAFGKFSASAATRASKLAD